LAKKSFWKSIFIFTNLHFFANISFFRTILYFVKFNYILSKLPFLSNYYLFNFVFSNVKFSKLKKKLKNVFFFIQKSLLINTFWNYTFLEIKSVYQKRFLDEKKVEKCFIFFNIRKFHKSDEICWQVKNNEKLKKKKIKKKILV